MLSLLLLKRKKNGFAIWRDESEKHARAFGVSTNSGGRTRHIYRVHGLFGTVCVLRRAANEGAQIRRRVAHRCHRSLTQVDILSLSRLSTINSLLLQSFSSVVGPNGSGKSNVIDALLFVFGKRAKQVRIWSEVEKREGQREFAVVARAIAPSPFPTAWSSYL